MSNGIRPDLLRLVSVRNRMAMIEDADVLSNTIDRVKLAAMYVVDSRIHALSDAAIHQYGEVRPVQDCLDEVIEARQMLRFYDNL